MAGHEGPAPQSDQAASRTTYRRARRRPAHLRTKTGCLTCRNRKKKCDETRTRCKNCTRQKLACVWQSLDNPLPHTRRRAHHSIENDLPSKVVQECASPTSLGPPSPLFPSLQHLPLGYSSAITANSGPLFDFLKTTFLPQLIRPATHGSVINGLSRETMLLAMNHPFCMHALLACCGAEIPTDTDCFRQLARFHYTGAVAGLRVVLSDRNLKSQWVVAMLTIMMLCIYERAKPKGSPGIEIHLVGAARLIEFHSRDSLIYGQLSQAEQAMHRLVRESYIFHVATSLPFQHSDAHHDEIEMALSLSEQAICQHFRPHLLSHPDSPVLGFPPYLFRCIYTVYRLYQSSRNKHITSQKCRKLDDDLRQWDRCTRPQTSKNTTANNQANLETAWTGPRLYILGCRILLRQISGSELAEVDPKIDHLIEEGMGIVRRLEPATDYYADYYCWPFLAIGLHLRSTSDRELLMDQVLAFRAATNNGTMRRLEDMLELIWQSRHAQSMAPATPASNQTG